VKFALHKPTWTQEANRTRAAAGDKLVGLLQLLFKALDGDERKITLSGPGELEAALSSVSAVLGFKAGIYSSPPTDNTVQSDDESSEP